MTPLENDQRSQGGLTRAKNQSDVDKKFLAMLAASRRPLLHDANLTPEDILRTLRDFAKTRPWIYFGIVGANKNTISHTLPDDVVLQRLNKVGGAIGFLGLSWFEGKLEIQVFYKPLRKGIQTIEKLDSVGRELKAVAVQRLEKILPGLIEGR